MRIFAKADGEADRFEVAFLRLQVALKRACAINSGDLEHSGWGARAAAAIHAGLAWAAASPDAAAALTTDALAEGVEGHARYQRLIGYLAECLHGGRAESAEAASLPSITECALAGGLLSMVARCLDENRAIELPALAADAVQFALTPLSGRGRSQTSRRRAAGMSGIKPRRAGGRASPPSP